MAAVQHVILANLSSATMNDPAALESLNSSIVQVLTEAAGTASSASAGLGDAEHSGERFSWGATVRFASPAAEAAFRASGDKAGLATTAASSSHRRYRVELNALVAPHLAPGASLCEFTVPAPSVPLLSSSMVAVGSAMLESTAVCVVTAGVVAKLVSRL